MDAFTNAAAERIWQAIATLAVPALAQFTVETVPSIDSTNSELMRRARAGQLAPTLLLADHQSAGRGRLGRVWQQAPTAALAFSLGLLMQPQDWQGLSLAVGVSVASSLHPGIGLKWPNDLYWQNRKLGGILIETASVGAQRYAVIGVGINIQSLPADGLRTAPAWLQELLPQANRASTLEQIAAPMVADMLAFQAQGFSPFKARFNALDVLQGREVLLHHAAPAGDGNLPEALAPAAGTAQGVDDTGALLVSGGGVVRRITSQEVSVRPA